MVNPHPTPTPNTHTHAHTGFLHSPAPSLLPHRHHNGKTNTASQLPHALPQPPALAMCTYPQAAALVVSRAATHGFTPGHLLAEGVPPSTQCMTLRACGKPCGREYGSTCRVTSAPPPPTPRLSRPHLPPMAR